jgi:anaerobic selenocysteine-containing dehydrogenase
MGSNMAENHPVAFQWVVEARERGAQVIHVDPRFTRTSAMSTRHVQIRAGSDIAFLGGIVNYSLEHGREFREYVVAGTNAPVIVREDFRDAEDLDGLFSGWDPKRGVYDVTSWQREGVPMHPAAGMRELGVPSGQRTGAVGAQLPVTEPRELDATLEHPRCVFRLLQKHFRRYTPELVEDVCGVPRRDFLAVAEALCVNPGASGRPPSSTRSGGRSTRSACRRSAPRRSSSYCSATSGGRGGGIIGAARPRVDPGLDGHADALRPPARVHPNAGGRAHAHARRVRSAERGAGRGRRACCPRSRTSAGSTRRAASTEPSAEAVLREISGVGPDGRALASFTELK